VNSTSAQGWAAVLKSLRPNATGGWTYARLNESTGGQVTTLPIVASANVEDLTQGAEGSTAARAFGFMRFPQSAQETLMTNSDVPSGFNHSRYRQGFRGGSEAEGEFATTNLTTVQIDTLAEAIVNLVRAHGPFRTLEEFVSPISGGKSVLENALDASGGPNTEIGTGLDFDGDSVLEPNVLMPMCSQRLTQADVLTAIGPFLQSRSDTFTIRAYGESVNSVTGEIDARAWCEATVQRIPTPVLSSDPIDQPVGPLGRRFQIVAFRWLSPSDI